jgi:hypothetical protein
MKSLKSFMRSQENEIVKANAPDSFKDDKGKPLEMEIKVLTTAEIRKLRKAYDKKKIAYGKNGEPIIQNGSLVYEDEYDGDKFIQHILVESLVFPDLKDAELMNFYKCVDVTEMPRLVFSKADEYDEVIKTVLGVQGIGKKATIEDAKN